MSFISSLKCIVLGECYPYNFHFSVFDPLSSVILWNPGKFPRQLTYPFPDPNKGLLILSLKIHHILCNFRIFHNSHFPPLLARLPRGSALQTLPPSVRNGACVLSLVFLVVLGDIQEKRGSGTSLLCHLKTGRRGHAVLRRTLGGHQFHTHASRHPIKPGLSAKPGQMESFNVCSLLTQTNQIHFPQLLLQKLVALPFPPYISPQLFSLWGRSI